VRKGREVHAHEPDGEPDDQRPGDEPVGERSADTGEPEKDDSMNAAEGPPPMDGVAENADGAVSVVEPDPATSSAPPAGPGETSEILPEGGRAGRRRRKNATRQAIEWLSLVIGAVVLALAIRALLFQAFYIPSASMAPTLEVNDRILVNKASYKLHSPHRGDIIVFKAPPGETSENIKDLVKRIIGLPGDTVEAKNNHVYIIQAGKTTGYELNEPYIKTTPDCPAGSQGPVAGHPLETVHVPAGEYFVMGDNRCASEDSRAFGPIKKSSIIGRAFIRIWPLNRIKLL